MPNNLDILLEVTTLPEQTLEDVQAYAPIRGAAGADGEDGQEVTLRVLSQVLQWKYVSDPSYTNLIDFTTLTLAATQITQDTSNRFVTDTEKTTWNAKQAALTNPVTGTGTTNNLAKFTASGTIGNSIASDDGSKMTVAGAADAFLVTSTGSGVTSELRQSSNNDVLHRFKRNGGNYWDARYFYTGEAFKFNYNDTPVLTLNTSGAATLAGALTAASASLTTPLTVGSGGTGLSTLTAGYIPFGNGTSAFGGSSSLFWDNTNSRLGIGTASPSYNLELRKDQNASTSFVVRNENGGASAAARFDLARSFGADMFTTFYYAGDGNTIYTPLSLNVVNGAGSTGGMFFNNLASAPIYFKTANTTRLTIGSTGIATFSNTTASTSTTTGALVVAGGVGIGGTINVGGKIGIGIAPTYGIHLQSSDDATALLFVDRIGGARFFMQAYLDGVYMGANSYHPVFFRTNNTTQMTLTSYGFLGIGLTPTAILHLKAGTATANTAPLKLTAGTSLTTPENGAIEFDGTNIYITVGGVRKTFTIT